MTVSVSVAASAAQAYQTASAAAAAAAANSAKNTNSGSAFSAIASGTDLLPGIASSGGSTLSSGMLSALLGINSGTNTPVPATGAPNNATSTGTTNHHHQGISALS